jgi:hypothetical protein
VNEEMATEIAGNLYDAIKKVRVPNEEEISEKAKRYVTLLRMQMELEKQKEQLYLELNELEKQEATNVLKDTTTEDLPEYLPVRDVAEILEVTPQMVRRYCIDGKIDARQRIEGSGKWLIPTKQFITHPNWNKYMDKKNKIKKQSVNIANKMLQYLEEDVD